MTMLIGGDLRSGRHVRSLDLLAEHQIRVVVLADIRQCGCQ